MGTLYQVLIGINLLLNGFVTGYYFCDQAITRDTRLYVVLNLILGIFLGFEVVLLLFILDKLIDLFNWLRKLTQLEFYFQFYCTKKWNKIPDDHIKVLDLKWEVFSGKKNNSLTTRHFLHTLKLLNKRLGREPRLQIDWKREEDEKRREEYNQQQKEKWPLKDQVNRSIPVCPVCSVFKSPPEDKEHSCYWCGNDYKENLN